MRGVHWVNLKFKDGNSINRSLYTYVCIAICIAIYVYQLMGVFCDMFKLCSTVALDSLTGQNKGRYREKELAFLLVSLYYGLQHIGFWMKYTVPIHHHFLKSKANMTCCISSKRMAYYLIQIQSIIPTLHFQQIP